jgi:hypothetical protein
MPIWGKLSKYRFLTWLLTIDKSFFPMPMKTLEKGVSAALPVIDDGGSERVNCNAGVRRSVAQASCVLIGMGYNVDKAMRLIQEKRAVADSYAGYIQKRIR